MTYIGLMRHRLALEVSVTTPDEAGGITEDYTLVTTLWAAIEPIRADIRGRNATLEQFFSHRITIRWRDDLDLSYRFRKENRIFAIKAVVDPDETRRLLHVMCEEVKS